MAVLQHFLRQGGVAVPLQEQADQGLGEAQQGHEGHRQQEDAFQYLDAEGGPQALDVPRAIELRAKDAGPGQAAEHRQVEHEHQLVGDGYAAHLGVAQRAHHQVVQEVDKVGYAVLDDHRDDDGQHGLVEYPIPDQGLAGTLNK